MIDLRSDTVTQPTEAMRAAMAEAPVGDDVYGDDPSINALERRVAELLGKEAAVYMPTGTMTNQVALRTHTEAGDWVLAEAGSHIFLLEGGAPAALSGLMIRQIPGTHGMITADQVRAVLPVAHRFMPKRVTSTTKLLSLENTHNVAGGTVWPVERIAEVTGVAREAGLATHLDGARLWNASAKSGVAEADYAAHFDTVSVCFSKGLGAPVGSALVGSAELIARARRFKQMFGGGFRQAGIVAAGALYALEHHRARLAEDHENARALGEGLAALPGIEVDLDALQTNIVRFTVTAMPAGTFAERVHENGIYMLPGGTSAMRAVTHLGISGEDIETALAAIRDVVTRVAA